MEFDEFNRQYKAARADLLAGDHSTVGDVQQHLRSLLPQLPTASDQQIASGLIDGLPKLLASIPRATSPEMEEAHQLLDAADLSRGTTQERIAEIVRLRRQIWEIADRAGADSAAIRGLTRGLERTEEDLTYGLPWNDPAPDQPGN